MDLSSRGGRNLCSRRGEGGAKLEKSLKRAQKWNFFEVKKNFEILKPFLAIFSGFRPKP